MIIFYAVQFFAGLRPGEAEGLTWENIHLDEEKPYIHILGSTSKSKETHDSFITLPLSLWINAYKPKDAKGPIGRHGFMMNPRYDLVPNIQGIQLASQPQQWMFFASAPEFGNLYRKAVAWDVMALEIFAAFAVGAIVWVVKGNVTGGAKSGQTNSP